MKTQRERILLVESDPDISDLIARQTLQPLGYRVDVIPSAARAIQAILHLSPDLVVLNFNLPDLSGKDLMVALNAQGFEVPFILIAQKGMEADIIQAFRLGANDYLLWPAREAEVLTAVERVLKQVRARREREALSRQLIQTNEELHRRVRELTTIFAIGKAVTSITDQRSLFEKIVEGAVYITEADFGWLLLRSDKDQIFKLKAQRNLPAGLASRLDQPWDDGISSLVALSGESLAIHGEPLKRFKVSQLGQSVLVVPVKLKKEIVGLLLVVRKSAQPFSPSSVTLLEAVVDYASISLVNARLFQVLEERARSMQQVAENAKIAERQKVETLKAIQKEIKSPAQAAAELVNSLLVSDEARLNAMQRGVLRSAEEKLKRILQILDALKTSM